MPTASKTAKKPKTQKQKLLETPDPDKAFWRELGDIRDFAQGLPEKFLDCRQLGHLWRPWHARTNEFGGYDVVHRCGRCLTKREQILNRRGMVAGTKYIHPDGYLSDGLGRITGEGRGVLRLESVSRQIAKLAEKATADAAAKKAS